MAEMAQSTVGPTTTHHGPPLVLVLETSQMNPRAGGGISKEED